MCCQQMHRMMPTEEWSRVPARDAIGLLVAFQQELFPRLESELGPMGEATSSLRDACVAVLELVRVEALLPYFRGQVGRGGPAALARAFIAAVFPTT